jgi:hypothetical protein
MYYGCYTTKYNKQKNIPAMKTTTYYTRKDVIAIIAVIILFALMMPLKAENGKNTTAELNEVQAASVQLALLNSEIEKAVEFTAPVLSGSFELMAAESQLEDLFVSVEKEAAYNSPALNENFETVDAIENLDNLNSEIEQAVRYTASPIAE